MGAAHSVTYLSGEALRFVGGKGYGSHKNGCQKKSELLHANLHSKCLLQ
jgi:hypothetical protein